MMFLVIIFGIPILLAVSLFLWIVLYDHPREVKRQTEAWMRIFSMMAEVRRLRRERLHRR